MAFENFFQAGLTEALAKQILAVIQRDIAASLATVDATLPVFSEYNFCFFPPTQWPALLLTPRLDTFTHPDSVQSRPQLVNFEATIALSNQDRNLLAQQAWRYVLAVDRIISSLGAQVNASKTPNFGDFYTPLTLAVPFPQSLSQSVINETTTPMQDGCVLGCWPVRIRYSDMLKTATSLEMTASLDFDITVDEV
jgi:hypothetical protein